MQGFDNSALMYNDDMTRKCFVAHSYDSPSQDTLLAACAEILPNFNLEPWYACYFSEKYQKLEDIHFDAKKSPLEKVVEMIANARYGIYDLTTWKDQASIHQARNVLIELGIAIGLNRPALLLRHNGSESTPLPKCFEGLDIVEFSGTVTLKNELKKHIPTWVNIHPEQDWSSRYCKIGQLKCEYREIYPRAKKWEEKNLSLYIFDGQDKDLSDFRSVVSDILSLYSDLRFDFIETLSVRKGFNFALCTTCQFSRTGDISLHRLTPNTPPEAFIAIGIAIAQEKYFGYEIPMIFIAKDMQEVPSLLSKYEIQLAENDLDIKTRLQVSIPTAVNQVRKTTWKTTSLPFIEPINKAPLHNSEEIHDDKIIDESENDINDSDIKNQKTMEELLNEQGLNVDLPKLGEMRRGMIASISHSQILVAIGAKLEGVISGREMDLLSTEEQNALKVGQEVNVYVINPEDENGNVVLSFKRAQEQLSWENVDKLLESNSVIESKITGFNKGGLIVAVEGLRGFVPSSQVSALRRTQTTGDTPEQRWQKMVGQPITVRVIEVDRERRRLILSERAASTESRQSLKERVLDELEVGQTYIGRVTSLANFGAFININGVDGLVDLSELSWDHIEHPKEVLEVGQEVKVKVIKIERDKKRIGLSVRALQEDSWRLRVQKYSVGQLVEGVITRLTKFGVFARLEGDLEGLIHISDVAEHRVEHPKEVVKEGEVKTFRIIRIDPDQHRIGLSLREVDSTAFDIQS